MRMMYKYGMVITLGMGMCLGVVESATPLWEDNGVVWGGTNSYYYRPGVSSGVNDAYDGIPGSATETTPTWIGSNASRATLNAAGGYLNITTAAIYGNSMDPNTITGSETSNFRNEAQWEATIAATIEISLRINSMIPGAVAATSLTFGNTQRWTDFVFGIHSSGDLSIHGTRITGVSATEFNTLRFVLNGMDNAGTARVDIYVNGAMEAAVTRTSFSTGALDYLRFGDASSSAATSGSVDYGFVRWVNGEAHMPIPEPGVIGILSLVGGILLVRNRQRS